MKYEVDLMSIKSRGNSRHKVEMEKSTADSDADAAFRSVEVETSSWDVALLEENCGFCLSPVRFRVLLCRNDVGILPRYVTTDELKQLY